MKSLYVSALAIAVAILAVSPALAQRQRGGGGGLGMYLNAKSVQEELKLSEDDAKKITDELGKLGRDLKPEERAEKTAKILSDNLKPDQLKRLNQIMWQRGGLSGAINNADVQTALKVDDKQKEKIKTIEEDFAKARRELFQGGGGGGGNREKMQELRKKADEDLNAVLTDDQKKAWKDLLGTEFKGEIPPPMRRPRNIQ
jgi:hypothetical protein